MTLTNPINGNFTEVLTARTADHGSALRVRAADVAQFGAAAGPLLSIHHFEMFKPFFGPHPHAGFSAVTYMFADSEGSFLNRDSLGARVQIAPGDLLWTFAGTGVLHDEKPIVPNVRCHGLQIFVNTPAARKHSPPRAFHLSSPEVPLFRGTGVNVRVLTGQYESVVSPFTPPEPVAMLDGSLETGAAITIPARVGWTNVIYVVRGAVSLETLTDRAHLAHGDSIAASATGALTIRAAVPTQVMVFSGPEWHETVVAKGPFVMSTQQDLRRAELDFLAGRMGVLAEEE
jgi:redox-sensitive bicupin YhaK (pirin superfamily)